jgi:hypothetical protein
LILLQQGRAQEALEHLRESLRLNPNNEEARRVMLHAIKAHWRAYRVILAYLGWARLHPKTLSMTTLSLVLVVPAVSAMVWEFPRLILACGALVFAFALLVVAAWIGDATTNVLLSFDDLGRRALSKAERIVANVLVTSASFLANV